MTKRLKVWFPIALAIVVALVSFAVTNWPSEDAATPPAGSTSTLTATSQPARSATAARTATTTARRDLSGDESAGGHTLARHVGRTDQQLLQRLRDEPDISAASTYTDRETAERTVAAALQRNESKVADWKKQGANRSNLALDFEAGAVIGRSIPRGKTVAHEVTSATIVLRANGQNWYVLTSYPDD